MQHERCRSTIGVSGRSQRLLCPLHQRYIWFHSPILTAGNNQNERVCANCGGMEPQQRYCGVAVSCVIAPVNDRGRIIPRIIGTALCLGHATPPSRACTSMANEVWAAERRILSTTTNPGPSATFLRAQRIAWSRCNVPMPLPSPVTIVPKAKEAGPVLHQQDDAEC
jgi:hypothetical protein